MGHTPFGYRIENGKAVIDNETAERVKALYQYYLSGYSLKTAAKKAGIKSSHAGIGNMLKNIRYLGDDYYPAIIDHDTFAATQAERTKRASRLGRIWDKKTKNNTKFPASFYITEATQGFDDPFQQAEYAYSLIEMEVNESGSKYECHCDSSKEAYTQK